jgi:hypothetical protein
LGLVIGAIGEIVEREGEIDITAEAVDEQENSHRRATKIQLVIPMIRTEGSNGLAPCTLN